jgi:hypothetical protein
MAVYFIRDTGTGFVKIGHGSDAWRRMQMLQTGCPTKLEVVAILDGGAPEEAALHLRFAAHRGAGEWFRPVAELAEYIEALPPAVRPARRGGTEDFWNGHSAEEVSRRTGIATSTLCEIRKGRFRPSPQRAIEIQRATGVSAIKLVFGDLADEAA